MNDIVYDTNKYRNRKTRFGNERKNEYRKKLTKFTFEDMQSEPFPYPDTSFDYDDCHPLGYFFILYHNDHVQYCIDNKIACPPEVPLIAHPPIILREIVTTYTDCWKNGGHRADFDSFSETDKEAYVKWANPVICLMWNNYKKWADGINASFDETHRLLSILSDSRPDIIKRPQRSDFYLDY